MQSTIYTHSYVVSTGLLLSTVELITMNTHYQQVPVHSCTLKVSLCTGEACIQYVSFCVWMDG